MFKVKAKARSCHGKLICFQGIDIFDKVVGGLVWCIETCNFDVDILLFQEDWWGFQCLMNFFIQMLFVNCQKHLFQVDREKNCPHRKDCFGLEGDEMSPHDWTPPDTRSRLQKCFSRYIFQLTFVSQKDCFPKRLFLVFQWLVAQVLETREARAETIRKVSTWQCGQHFKLHPKKYSRSKIVLDELSRTYAPKRCFKQKVISIHVIKLFFTKGLCKKILYWPSSQLR